MKRLKKWWQKTLVFLVALLTLGIIPPNHSIWDHLENGQDSNRAQSANYKNIGVAEETVESFADENTETVDPIDSILQLAKEQSYIKFGSKIAPVIEDEFEQRIFPTIEQIISSALANLDDETKRYLTISGKPGEIIPRGSFILRMAVADKICSDSMCAPKNGRLKDTTTISITTLMKINLLHTIRSGISTIQKTPLRSGCPNI